MQSIAELGFFVVLFYAVSFWRRYAQKAGIIKYITSECIITLVPKPLAKRKREKVCFLDFVCGQFNV